MNYVERLFDEVHYVFNLNAATLSGAIDILVIPQADGSLKCTPFHVRFGKLQLISSSEKVVSVYVNALKTNLQMKLGHAGEAFFVEETEEPVPAILATSPITSPKPGRAASTRTTSTEELVSEFRGSRIITKPSSQSTTLTQTTSSSTSTTTTLITAGSNNNEMKPLTEALEEIIQKSAQSTITLSTSPLASASSMVPRPPSTTTSPTKKRDSIVVDKKTVNQTSTTPPIKRASSPVYFEGIEDITLDSPINSYIINCESEPQTPVESPIGSPPEKHHENNPPSAETSDSESDQKVGFWRWGGLPKFIRRNNVPAAQQQQQPAAASTTTTISSTSTTMTTTTKVITTTVPSDPIDTLQASLPLALDIKEESRQSIDSTYSGDSGSLHSHHSQSHSLDSQDDTHPIDMAQLEMNPSATPTNTPVDGQPIDENGDSSSWSRMGSFLKRFNKKDLEPTFLVKQSTPPASLDLESGSNPLNSSHDEIFMLEEEEEEQEERKKGRSQQSRVEEIEEPTTVQVNEVEDDSIVPNGLTLPASMEKSYASIVKQNSFSKDLDMPPLLPLPTSAAALNRSEDDQFINEPKALSPSPSPSRHSMNVRLSLCGHLILDRNLQSEPEERERFFQEHIVTYEQLCGDVALFKNPHLVAKVDNEFFPWAVAGHIIMSSLSFNKPLTPEALESLRKKDKEERVTTKAATGKSWKNWLWKSTDDKSKNQSGNPLSESAPMVTPPTSTPLIGAIPTTPPQAVPSSALIVAPKDHSYAKKSLRPTSDQLKSLGLKKGANRITFVVSSTLQGTREVSASIYLWENTSKIVISDIDGTITKSDVFGQVLPFLGKDWSHIGVAELYSNIKENGYNIIYLTSRAIGQAGLTRTYISSVKQPGISNGGSGANPQMIPFTLPEGPVFMSPNRLLTSFNREVIKRNPEEFKIACLQDIANIFPANMGTPFYAGFGNRSTDACAYNAVGIPSGKIFTINAYGIINTSNNTYNKSYTKLNDLVQDMFPSASGKHVDEQWNEYHFWKKTVIPLKQLEPI
eukprot:gene10893-12695_t